VMFSYQGMGRILIEAVFGNDYFMVAGIVAILSVGYVLVNFVVDILYSVLDPRIRTVDA
jgi:peptide/nickel transport system permease protein